MSEAIRLLYSPFPSHAAAAEAARALLAARQVGCCNLLPGVTALYAWQGALEESQEVVLLAKTTESQAEEAARHLARLHPYTCPAILILAAHANTAYAQWLAGECTPEPAPPGP